jgi:serine/threonine protein kinase/predicted ATPase
MHAMASTRALHGSAANVAHMNVDVGSVVGGRYRITGALGRGGMGAVFLAVQDPLGREVALKVLTPELANDVVARERFLREAKAVSRLNHPNVVTVHDFGTEPDGTLYLVMERVAGRPLRAILDEKGALRPAEALSLLTDVCRGVAAAHRAGIVHGDLKPENILVSSSGERVVKVLDFGLARLQASAGEDPTVTRAGQILGTPRYLSPEQIRGVRDNPSSDVYAMGIMLFEMLTGRPPFDESTVPLLIVEHITSTPPAPGVVLGHTLPEDLDELTLLLLRKEPNTRPKDADALLPMLAERAARLSMTRTMSDVGMPSFVMSGPRAPEGDITLVFTDIESSSSLWERVPALMREGLRLHDEIMRRHIAETGGYEVKTQGDSFMIAYARVEDAARFATAIQTALIDAPWADALLAEKEAAPVVKNGRTIFRGLRVRVGFFCGTPDCRADPVSQRMDYFGPVVNRAARVESAAHGGQVLYGHEDQQRRTIHVDGVDSRALGPVRLKGIETPIHLVELRPASLSARSFAPPRTVDAGAPSNLPSERASLIGRDALTDDVVTRTTSGARVLSLVGAAGVGKSRVALRAARVLAERHAFPGGTFHVPLAEERRGLDVLVGIARALELTLLNADSEERALAQLSEVLSTRAPTLLVLDDIDRMGAALAPIVDGLTRGGASVFILTGRAPARARGERTIEVPPLDEDDAIALFDARVRESGGALAEADAPDVKKLVNALDGLPLALELAAGRARMMKPRQLVERLSRRFDLLKASGEGGARGATLRGALDLSWETLSDLERSALAQCSVFEGHFSLDAAEHVVDVSALDDMAFILDVLDVLRERSLLRALHSDALGEVRFMLYESVRAYARERRAELVDDGALIQRYAQHTVENGERLAALVHTPRAPEALEGLVAERLHLDAVVASGPGALAVRAALALAAFYGARGPVAAHRALVQQALERADKLHDEPLLLSALNVRGRFEAVSGDSNTAISDLTRAATIALSLKDESALAYALQGTVRAQVRNLDAKSAHIAMDHLQPLVDKLNDARLSALVENERMLFTFSKTIEAAEQAASRALAHVARAGDRELEARICSNFGIIHSLRGFPREAYPHLERALMLARDTHARPLEGLVLGNMGSALLMMGKADDAISKLRSAVEIHIETGNRLVLSADRGTLAFCHFARGDDDVALPLLDLAEAGALELDARRERAQALLWRALIYLARRELDRVGPVLETLEQMSASLVTIGFARVYDAMAMLRDAVASEGTSEAAAKTATLVDEIERVRHVGGPATAIVAFGIRIVLDRRAAAKGSGA